MPLYEYQCDRCAHRFEIIQKFSDPPVDSCPKCGGEVKKLLSSPAIQFKGSGWYITDYARAGKSESAGQGEKKDKKPEAASAGESATAGESKTGGESKTESSAKTGSSKTGATSASE